MKTLLPVVLAVAASGGLAWYGLAPAPLPVSTEPVPAAPVTVQKQSVPIEGEEFPFVVNQVGPPPPFDKSRPLVVRVPPGYELVSPGDYTLNPEGNGFWNMPGGGGPRQPVGWSLHASSLQVGGVWLTQLYLNYLQPGGQDIILNGQPYYEPWSFSDAHAIAADGTWTPGRRPQPNTTPRFPNAAGPWFVFQP